MKKISRPFVFAFLMALMACDNADIVNQSSLAQKDAKDVTTTSAVNHLDLTKYDFIATVGNKELTDAEIKFLTNIEVDPINQNNETLATIDDRLKQLILAGPIFSADQNDVAAIRVNPSPPRPPAPCPVHHCLDVEINIDNFLLGEFADIMIDLPGKGARTASLQPSIMLTDKNGDVFAKGIISRFDPLLHIAWFTFEPVNRSLAKSVLTMEVQSYYQLNGQVKPVFYKVTFPENTFH